MATMPPFSSGATWDAYVSSALLDQALELYHERDDKQWTLTDCTSFIIMRERSITEALTGDHHFEQAGFTALLK
jgi:predicted nucleic acid-binding protein